jgi:hypothetical protein
MTDAEKEEHRKSLSDKLEKLHNSVHKKKELFNNPLTAQREFLEAYSQIYHYSSRHVRK